MSRDGCNVAHAGTLEINALAVVFSACGTMIAWTDYYYYYDDEDEEENVEDSVASDIYLWDEKSLQELFASKEHKGSAW